MVPSRDSPGLRTVLTATDLSSASDLAVDRASVLAREHAAHLVVLSVGDDTDDLVGLAKRVRQQLGRLGVEAEIDTRSGPPFVEIIRAARERDASLVVTGAHGYHWQRLALTGSTAERVVRKGDRPVLVVRQPCSGPYARVLTAVDGSEYSLGALRFALSTFEGAEHRLVHAVGLPGTSVALRADPGDVRSMCEAAQVQLAAVLDGIWQGEPPAVLLGYPAEVISDFAVRWGADLVVVGTHGRGALPYVLLGSTAQHVLRETPTDVLLVRAPDLAFELP